MANRQLKERTREHYEMLLGQHLLKAFGTWPLSSITADDVRAWHAKCGADRPTTRAHGYGLLRTILGTALSDGKISVDPCVIRGAGTTKRAHKIRPASLAELQTIADEMPKQYQAMILLASWCALRFGELTELRRKDIVLSEHAESGETVHTGVIRVERGVVRVGDGFQIPPRSLKPVRATWRYRHISCRF